MNDKKKSIDKLKIKLKKSICMYIDDDKLNLALSGIHILAGYLYDFNQEYYDEDLENFVLTISSKFLSQNIELKEYNGDNNTILFYDGFGLDNRGHIRSYLSALISLGYKIVYVTKERSRESIPNIKHILNSSDNKMYFYNDCASYTEIVNQLLRIAAIEKPKNMFYYTTPNDVSAAVFFAMMKDKTNRFFIDLTDHAYWLGVKCNDYFIGGREMSGAIGYYYRNIPKKQLLKVSPSIIPPINNCEESLPFDIKKEKYIFSGGALYKTLGDKDNIYYKIVSHILQNHHNVFFLYAGTGDTCEMEKIINSFPNRAFIISERPDFYELIKNCTLYLNTYPMFGGLMMRYAALAGRIPITLIHNNDADGQLREQKSRKIEYYSYNELIKNVDLLLINNNYRCERENLLKGSVVTEKEFEQELKKAINSFNTSNRHEFIKIDTSKFRKEFYDRFNLSMSKVNYFSVKNLKFYFTNLLLFDLHFIILTTKKILRKKIWKKF